MAEKADFLRLFIPLQGDLLAYILSMGVRPEDADDLLQDSATVMFTKIGHFEAGTNFRAWAFKIVRNEILSYFRKGAKRPLRLSEEAFEDIEYLAANETEVPSVRLKALTVCLEKLQEHAKSMVMMRYRDNMTVQAIARVLSRPVDSIYTTMSRIRKSLQECILRFERLEGKTA
ncbi:MAG: sigma-70 family RNA polymerase sigma factor [Kiritimatiellae bacterium]|nr:sigma-70 family RNA polymerase sigma factor [Kiritimatiellia bacterium]